MGTYYGICPTKGCDYNKSYESGAFDEYEKVKRSSKADWIKIYDEGRPKNLGKCPTHDKELLTGCPKCGMTVFTSHDLTKCPDCEKPLKQAFEV